MSPQKTDGCTWDQCGFTWSELALSGKSWAELEICQPRPDPDPDAGYTWEDIAKAELEWQMLTDEQLSWQEWQELVPGGNWEDSLTVSAVEGEKIFLQVNAVNVSVTRGIIFTIAYDPSALGWEGKFSNHEIGLVVEEGPHPDVISHENGELKLHFPTPQNNPWSGVVVGLMFRVNKTGITNIELK